jgi:hypothetical protein
MSPFSRFKIRNQDIICLMSTSKQSFFLVLSTSTESIIDRPEAVERGMSQAEKNFLKETDPSAKK